MVLLIFRPASKTVSIRSEKESDAISIRSASAESFGNGSLAVSEIFIAKYSADLFKGRYQYLWFVFMLRNLL